MKINLSVAQKQYQADLSRPIDLSIEAGQVACYGSQSPESEPVIGDGFVGSVKLGGPVNHFSIKLTPHGQGTHTECFGHISANHESVNRVLTPFHYIANLISLHPVKDSDGNFVINQSCLRKSLDNELNVPALIIRTLPNPLSKLTKDYTNTNPAYLDPQFVEFLIKHGVKHLLIDLPSIDPEEDAGALLAHKTFWQNGHPSRDSCTITELVYIPDQAKDGLYLLNLQIAPIPLDAVPSKPVIFELSTLV